MLTVPIQQLAGIQAAKMDSGVPFKQGQIFFGSIQKIFPNQTAVVQAGNHPLIAKLEAPLISGKGYWFEVSLNEGEVYLKVVPNNSLEGNDSGALLKQLSLPQEKAFKQVAAYMQKEQIPLSKEEVIKAAAFLKEAPDSALGLKTIQLMASKQFPFSKAIFQSLVKAEDSQKTQTLIQLLKGEIIKETPNKTIQSLLSVVDSLDGEEKNRIIQEMPQALLKYSSNQASQFQSISENILNKLGLNGTDTNSASEPKATVGSVILKKEPAAEPQPVDIKKQVEEKLQNVLKGEGDSKNIFSSEEQLFLKKLADQLEQSPHGSRIAMQLKGILGKMGLFYEADIQKLNNQEDHVIKSLKPLLVKYLEEPDHPSDTKEIADLLISKMNSQQLLSSDTGPILQAVFQLPFQIGNHFTDITMQWSGKRKENGELDADFCQILFYLDLEHLKETIVDMKVQNRVVSVTILNTFPRAEDLSLDLTPLLKKQLENQGYTLSAVSFRQQAETSAGKNPVWSTTTNTPYAGVDIKI
ncbi:hypothetical protein [Heyndrickxia acidicola]|uniref:Flagellar hook-length control protein FliK n=1 Tax=Heyndrickxia acidicola TaxID=209389 RepID=A0ABU6MBN2_9BACI|nr:hypothetical protein [Heyndrickxia acidicola]MED1202090.1 hypothetical protein [Heyndrickxia acidicola]